MSTYEMILEEGRKREREVSQMLLEKALHREQLERQRAEEERQRLNNVILYLYETTPTSYCGNSNCNQS